MKTRPLQFTRALASGADLILVRPMKALIAIAGLFAATLSADAAHSLRADVYFRGWYSERFVAVSPAGLRDEAHRGASRSTHLAAGSQLNRLLAVLDLPHLHTMRGDTRHDTYLVVDLFDSTGARTTYRGDNRYLWSADCTRGREIDEHFRKFFEQLMPRPNQAMQPTAGRPGTSLNVTSTLPLQTKLALASGS